MMPKAKNWTFILVSIPNQAINNPVTAVRGINLMASTYLLNILLIAGNKPIKNPRSSEIEIASAYPNKLSFIEYKVFRTSKSSKCSSLNDVNTANGFGRIDLPTKPVKVSKHHIPKIINNPIKDKKVGLLSQDFFTIILFLIVYCGRSSKSVLLFFARPSSESLPSIGLSEPLPTNIKRFDSKRCT